MVSKNRCLKVGMGPHEDDGAACKALRANGHKMPVILRVIAKVSLKAKYVYSLSLFQWPIIIITDTGHIFVVCLLFLARQPPVGQGLLIHEVSRSHTTTHHSRQDSSGRVISSSLRPLPDNTHNGQTSMPPVGFEPSISAGERP